MQTNLATNQRLSLVIVRNGGLTLYKILRLAERRKFLDIK